MAGDDSDSSEDAYNDVETNVLLGYAVSEETVDSFSQLGGQPTWVDDDTAPDGALGRCQVCRGPTSLLLQLHGNLHEKFPGHERRLYVFSCRKKTCRRKNGAIRALRGLYLCDEVAKQPRPTGQRIAVESQVKPATGLGQKLFGVKSDDPLGSQQPSHPSAATPAVTGNPFSPANRATHPIEAVDDTPETSTDGLCQTLADKVRVAAPPQSSQPARSAEPWPVDPSPYPSYHIDADKEYLELVAPDVPPNARVDNADGGFGGGAAAHEKELFESTMDKTFQQFADRLAQNPEQVLRYEFRGQPLLYSGKDEVGKLLSPAASDATKVRVASAAGSRSPPRCDNCGATRVPEFQLAPQAITKLEAQETTIDGMDWGTIIVCVCSEDCQEKGKIHGQVGYVEEWVGVQWEEIEESRDR